jgi:hypothetical protein
MTLDATATALTRYEDVLIDRLLNVLPTLGDQEEVTILEKEARGGWFCYYLSENAATHSKAIETGLKSLITGENALPNSRLSVVQGVSLRDPGSADRLIARRALVITVSGHGEDAHQVSPRAAAIQMVVAFSLIGLLLYLGHWLLSLDSDM